MGPQRNFLPKNWKNSIWRWFRRWVSILGSIIAKYYVGGSQYTTYTGGLCHSLKIYAADRNVDLEWLTSYLTVFEPNYSGSVEYKKVIIGSITGAQMQELLWNVQQMITKKMRTCRVNHTSVFKRTLVDIQQVLATTQVPNIRKITHKFFLNLIESDDDRTTDYEFFNLLKYVLLYSPYFGF